MRNFVLGAAILALAGLALLSVHTTPARAQTEYPWCGHSRECAGGCTFSTYEQCQAFIAGAGGNNRYTANAAALPRPRR